MGLLMTAFLLSVRVCNHHNHHQHYRHSLNQLGFRLASTTTTTTSLPTTSLPTTSKAGGKRKNDSHLPVISWYPGHIAKAERELSEKLKVVDVVVEVRDLRIPLATTHPLVPQWIGSKPWIVALVRTDQVSKQALLDWQRYYKQQLANHAANNNNSNSNTNTSVRQPSQIFFVNARIGAGVNTLRQAILSMSDSVNRHRIKRGIEARPTRAAVIGFPNVGKSALINQLLRRRLAKSRNIAGVTRQLQWIRLSDSMANSPSSVGSHSQDNRMKIELLDSPGIIPAVRLDRLNAVKLAICNDIGEASYDRTVVAAQLCDLLNELHQQAPTHVDMKKIMQRYTLPSFTTMTGEDILSFVAEKYCQGNPISGADKLLSDFRNGHLGYSSLESTPIIPSSTTATTTATTTIGEEEEVEELQQVGATEALAARLDVRRGNYEGW